MKETLAKQAKMKSKQQVPRVAVREWPDAGIKSCPIFPKSCPKVPAVVLTYKVTYLKNSPKRWQVFWATYKDNLVQTTFKNSRI